jgi:predicted DCC family thiol-disulfide oxidoreductase YuxK
MGNAQTGPIIFIDGECVLCNGFADFVRKRDRPGRYRFAALQGETAAAMGTADALPPPPLAAGKAGEADALRSMLLHENGVWYRKSDAALRVLAGLGGAWGLARPLLGFPRFLRDAVYDFIARNRYRWFGKRDNCRLPAAADRGVFLP